MSGLEFVKTHHCGVAWECLMCRRSHVVEEISSPDVALSRPGTYSNRKNDLQKTTEILKNREAPMTLTTVRPVGGKEREKWPPPADFSYLKSCDGN